MSSTSRSDVFSNYPELLALPAGVTAVISSIPGQLGLILKYVSGGSLSVLRNPEPYAGTTTVGTSFATAGLYTLATTEILNVSMAGDMYLIATGATCVANMLRLRSQGT